MDAHDILTKGRIQLQEKNPFFSYLSLFLKLREAKKGELPDWAGMGVDIEGNLIYNKEWVEGVIGDNNNYAMGVLTHEILHLSLLHLLRRKEREPDGWNIASDIVANSLLTLNGFSLPQDCIIPVNDEIKLGNKVIEKCSEKIAEEIYDELPKEFKQKKKVLMIGVGKGSKGGNGGKGDGQDFKSFDKHFEYGNGKGKDGKSLEERRKLESDWLNKIEEAYTISKMRGDVPAGIERILGKLHKEQINWRELLNRSLIKMLPVDFTWSRRNKKSMATNNYFPDVTRESVDVVVTIDTSGSIGQEELSDFLSEIIGIARAYQNQIRMRLFIHDVLVCGDYEVINGNIEQIKKIKIKGGGGTSHLDVFNQIKKKVRDCKAVISFTDGFSDLNDVNFKDYYFDKIFVISKNGSDEQIKNKNCKIIKIR